MKNFTTSFLIFLFIAITFIGCSTESDDEKDTQNSTNDYWPTSVDNNWVYTQGSVENSVKITEVDERNGAKYYSFNQLDIFGDAVEEQPVFSIKKNKGDYYINVGEINITSVGTAKITGYEFILFKDYLGVNETWEGTYTYTKSYSALGSQVFVANATFKGKILEKGISLTVKGKVFNDVIKFRFEQIIDNNDAWPDWDYSTDFWIAKNVGIIKFENVEGVSEITSYLIK
jgi:hypothetical protein